MQFTLALFALATAVLAAPEPAITNVARQASEVGGGLAGTLGPFEGTLGGAINGPTGFVQGCIGGAVAANGVTECFPVATAPAKTDTKSHEAAGNAAGTLGPLAASGFADADGLCAGGAIGAVGANGFTTCLVPTKSA